MENASKALIMAAIVLLAMLLMSFMIYLFNIFGSETTRVNNLMDKTEITEFNQKYLKYDNRKDLTAEDVQTIINLNNFYSQSGKMTVEIYLNEDSYEVEEDEVDEKLNDYNYSELKKVVQNDYNVLDSLQYRYGCKVEFGKEGTIEYVKEVKIYGVKVKKEI